MTDALFSEVVASARTALPETALGERAAWVSSALALWREPGVADDPTADDAAFVEWLADHRDPTADLLLATIGSLGLGSASTRAAQLVAPPPPPTPGRAWRLVEDEAEVVAIEMIHATDDREVLLIDIDHEGLSGVTFITEADGLVDFAAGEGSVAAIEMGAAASRGATALNRRAESPGAPDDAELANMVLLRARLELLGETTVEPRWLAEVPLPVTDPNADAAAIRTLTSALTDRAAAPPPPAAAPMVEAAAQLVRWEQEVGRPIQELEALATLEWADWLGAVIGVVRAGVGAAVSGEILVDHVNRCPEVTSVIPKADRRWFAWAFAVAIETWREIGVVDDDLRLTEAGRSALPQALLFAWAPIDGG